MTLFFDWQGVILCEFLGRRETVTAERYVQTLKNLKEAVCKKRPHLWQGQNFWIHHDNAKPHTTDFTMAKIRQWGLKILQHPPYSPDCAPCDFNIFPAMKKHLRGCKFPNVAALQAEARRVLKEEVDQSVFSDSLHEMVTRWQKCVAVNSKYFEGDGVEVDPLFEHLDSTKDSSDDD